MSSITFTIALDHDRIVNKSYWSDYFSSWVTKVNRTFLGLFAMKENVKNILPSAVLDWFFLTSLRFVSHVRVELFVRKYLQTRQLFNLLLFPFIYLVGILWHRGGMCDEDMINQLLENVPAIKINQYLNLTWSRFVKKEFLVLNSFSFWTHTLEEREWNFHLLLHFNRKW